MKNSSKIVFSVILAGLAVLGLFLFFHHVTRPSPVVVKYSDPDLNESSVFWRSNCQVEMLSQTTNFVVGINRILDIRLDDHDATEPSNWTGFVTVENINHLGGIDRTQLDFAFDIWRSDSSHGTIVAYLDPEHWGTNYWAYEKRFESGDRSVFNH